MTNNEELTPTKLKIAYFFVSKRRLLKRIFLGLFIIVDLIIWFYFLYHFTLYLIESKDYQQMEKELGQVVNINYEQFHQKIKPLMPEVVFSKAIALGQNRYNFICLVKNPNHHWHINLLKYHFVWSNNKSPSFTTFLLPNEEKILVSFNNKVNELPLDLTCQIEEINWQRIRQDRKYLLEVFNKFIIKDLKYLPAKEENEKDITTFKFINSTIYNFWQIILKVAIYQGREIVAVNQITLKEILSQEEREIKIVWPTSFSFISEIKVFPEVNVFDPSSFMPKKF